MRIPGLASLADAGYNIGTSAYYGFTLPDRIANVAKTGEGVTKLFNPGTHIKSVGGALTAFGGAGIGAIAGAAIGSQIDGAGAGIGAAVGAVAGAAALPAAGLAARGAVTAGVALGKGAWAAAPYVGAGMMKTAGFAGQVGLNMAGKGIKTVAGFGSKLVKWDAAADSLSKVKLTGLGKSVLWGGAVVGGLKDALGQVEQHRMGQMDGQVTRATPRMAPSYANNAGATGDLVFALNANRRG